MSPLYHLCLALDGLHEAKERAVAEQDSQRHADLRDHGELLGYLIRRIGGPTNFTRGPMSHIDPLMAELAIKHGLTISRKRVTTGTERHGHFATYEITGEVVALQDAKKWLAGKGIKDTNIYPDETSPPGFRNLFLEIQSVWHPPGTPFQQPSPEAPCPPSSSP
jgi:hypothetical protein